jgi:hypothetical protein
MASDHVDIQRARLAQFGRMTSSRRGVVSSKAAAQAQRASSTMRCCFYPRERPTVEPTETVFKLAGGTCPVAYTRTTVRKWKGERAKPSCA